MEIRKRIPTGVSLLAAVLLGFSDGQKVAGPYEIVVEHMETCPPKLLDRPFPVTVSSSRYGHDPHEKYFNGNFTTSLTFDDNVNSAVVFDAWSSRGGWKENAVVMKFSRLCSSMSAYLPTVWQHLRTHVYGSRGLIRDCPAPPDTYSVYNLTTPRSSALIPALFYGKWRVNLRAFLKEQCFMCIRIVLRVEPKVPPSSQG
ncbi:uncharacterized protein LOC117648234 isoform X3 [Thrips palmi]|uniref:Uncharacterized protein LOC117648234 isoform X3 n=1 Tax=Thrips palmi TaxID=161013 RepID=A0A6P8ZQV4_THRPL|nr:uncharacterized protein LOC117648234 isoform X3 [Thrips palmi]